MPIKGKPAGPDYKARLEEKLALARETPEPVFDLSNCNLKKVPSDIFSLCKVFRKEALHLQKNQLTTLQNGGHLEDLKNLILLDVSTNNFSKLPNNIDVLENLQVLNLSKNQLSELPNAIGGLHMLIVLDISNNQLKYLPNTIGNCESLEVLDISNNERLKKLPSTLGKLGNLMKLELDAAMTYPPADVCKKGVKEILAFLRKELGITEVPSTSTKAYVQNQIYNKVEERLKQQEELKQNRQKELLQFEKALAEQKEEEVRLQEQSKQQKAKVLEDIKANEMSFNKELAKVQEKKNQERAALIKLCQEEEEKSYGIVNKILQLNKSAKLEAFALWEMERKKEESFLLSNAKSTKAMKQKEILDGMGSLMEEEILKARNDAAEKRERVLNSLTSEMVLQEEELYNFLKKRDMDSAQLMEAIRKNENLQKMAVTSLLEKSDAASWQLAKEISIIEAELTELTKIELKKKKLQTDAQIVELNQNRIALTKLLIELFEKQAQRRNFLIEMMKKWEQLRESYTGSDAFWMNQYNKLFDSKSHQMVKFLESVDQKLVYELFLNEVFQYLPLLKDVAMNQKDLEKLNMDRLIKLGIDNPADRRKIMEAVQSFLSYKKALMVEPSAPVLLQPSAPMDFSIPEECVVCLDKKPEIVFVPCGHICCCYKCYCLISTCPLCRQPVDKVFDLMRIA